LTSIQYTIVGTPLGALLVAATDRGICLVCFGDEEAELESRLQGEFPFAAPTRDDSGLQAFSDEIVSYVKGHTESISIPLDVGGSRFQRRVWDALRRIPRGETRSYSALAKSLGQPGAARAVARACAANPVLIVVPCHRVVPKTGDAGGYAGGVERKRSLLALEVR
jgi:AraC family transcriptional regulator of adaptative response/methylated-DNA-[protein]-cysteine methyltransferase